jgi:Kef-type K+ transport system membrane component KefB
MSTDTLVAWVLGDAALVITVASLLGWLARRLGQPTVVGQIIAGILLGPTLVGRLPGHLFPPQVIAALTVLAQLAVVMFMFVVPPHLAALVFRARADHRLHGGHARG